MPESRSKGAATKMSNDDIYDSIIIGAGPGGIQLGYFYENSAPKENFKYVILEKNDTAGSFWQTFPRGKELVSFNKVNSVFTDPEINLKWDWNSLLDNGGYEIMFPKYGSRRLYPLRDEMHRYLGKFVEHHHINIQYETTVTSVGRVSGAVPAGRRQLFVVRDAAGRVYRTETVVMANGLPIPYVPDIPGIEHAEGYEDVSWDPEAFDNQRVLIIGKGNSGFEFAENITQIAAAIHIASPQKVQMSWRTRHPGHVRVNYTTMMDMYQLKTLNSIIDAAILNIEKVQNEQTGRWEYDVTLGYSHADGEVDHIRYDRIVRSTGFSVNFGMLEAAVQPDMLQEGLIANRLPYLKSNFESVNVPGLFFAGTIMQSVDFKVSSSQFIDGFRYNCRSLFYMLCDEYWGGELPSVDVELPVRGAKAAKGAAMVAAAAAAAAGGKKGGKKGRKGDGGMMMGAEEEEEEEEVTAMMNLDEVASAITHTLVERASWASSMWTVFNVQADVVLVKATPCGRGVAEVRYFRDLTTFFVLDRWCRADSDYHVFLVTLEWGQWSGDGFEIERHPSVEAAHTSVFLHPIVRHFYRSEVPLTVHHFQEDLTGIYMPKYAPDFIKTHNEKTVHQFHDSQHVRPCRAYFAAELARMAEDGERTASDRARATAHKKRGLAALEVEALPSAVAEKRQRRGGRGAGAGGSGAPPTPDSVDSVKSGSAEEGACGGGGGGGGKYEMFARGGYKPMMMMKEDMPMCAMAAAMQCGGKQDDTQMMRNGEIPVILGNGGVNPVFMLNGGLANVLPLMSSVTHPVSRASMAAMAAEDGMATQAVNAERRMAAEGVSLIPKMALAMAAAKPEDDEMAQGEKQMAASPSAAKAAQAKAMVARATRARRSTVRR